MQMYAGMTTHIVLFARIGKEIRLGASLHAGIEERQTVLWHHRRIVVTRDDLQLAFQILGLGDETGLRIAFRVVVWCTHVTLAIHHLIPLPVDDGTASHTYLEDIGVVGDQ